MRTFPFHTRHSPTLRLFRSLDHPPDPAELDRCAGIFRGSFYSRRDKTDKEDKAEQWDDGDDPDDPNENDWTSSASAATSTSVKADSTTSVSKYDDGQWHPSSTSTWSASTTTSSPVVSSTVASASGQTPWSANTHSSSPTPSLTSAPVLAASATASVTPHNKVSATIAIPLSILSIIGLGMVLLCARGLYVARKRNKQKQADLEKGGDWAERFMARIESASSKVTDDEKAKDEARRGVSVTMRAVSSYSSNKDLPRTPALGLATQNDRSWDMREEAIRPPPAARRGMLLHRFDTVRRTLFGRRGRYAAEDYEVFDRPTLYDDHPLDTRDTPDGAGRQSRVRSRSDQFGDDENFTRMPPISRTSYSRSGDGGLSLHSRERYSTVEETRVPSRHHRPLSRYDSSLSRLSSIKEYFSTSRRSASGIGGVDMREPDVDDYYFSAAAQRHSYPSHRARHAHAQGEMRRYRSYTPPPTSPLFDQNSMYNPHVPRDSHRVRLSRSGHRMPLQATYARTRSRMSDPEQRARGGSDYEYERVEPRRARPDRDRLYAMERGDSRRSAPWSDSEVGGSRWGDRR